MPGLPRVDVVVVAYGPEPELASCLDSVLRSEGVCVRVALVDNGCTRPDLADLCADDRVQVVRPAGNVGFSRGCNLGVAALGSEFVALVNSDAYVDPRALSRLVTGLVGDVGVTTACVLLANDPGRVNSVGNPVHYLGISWAGGWGDSSGAHTAARDVASASGAGVALRRALWEELGGFDPALFMYCEDLELSLRVWQHGLRVRYVPEARVWHHYEFSRNERKWYFLERNRLQVLLTVYELRTLAVLTPVLVGFELALLLAAAADRRLGAKLKGYGWLLRHAGDLRRRRALVQGQRAVGDSVLLPVLADTLEGPALTGAAVALANVVLAAYWRWLARPLLQRRGR